jgi:hypothetical protein
MSPSENEQPGKLQKKRKSERKLWPKPAPSMQQTDLLEKRNQILGTPPGVLVHYLPIIVVRGARAGIHHNCSIQNGIRRIFPSATCHQPFFNFPQKGRRINVGGGGRRNAQLTLPPPPRHCPTCTAVKRPPSAALGRLTCMRTVRAPGAMCDSRSAGCLCAGSLCVVGPASSTRMRRSGSAVARRLAMMQPAVPPTGRTFCQKRRGKEEGDCVPPAMMTSYSSLMVVGVDIVPLLLQT